MFMYTSYRGKVITLSKNEFQFSLTSGRHVGVPRKDTNMASGCIMSSINFLQRSDH